MAKQYRIARLDAQGKQIVLVVEDSTGARVTAEGSVTMALADVLGKEIKFREVKVCDDSTSPPTVKKMLVLGSEMYT